MTSTRKTISPVEFDTALAAKYLRLAELRDGRARDTSRAHYAAGDTKTGDYGRRRVWKLSDEQAIALSGDIAQAIAVTDLAISAVVDEIDEANDIYRAAPWSRFILCLSTNGHIHDAVGCYTLRYDSQLEWHPEFSGSTVEQAVAALGEALCSVCFPSAPVAYRAKNLTQVAQERTRGEREAKAAAKADARYLKELRPEEAFRSSRGDTIATVYAAKEIIRKAVECAVEVDWYDTPAAAAKWAGHPAESFARVRRNVGGNLEALRLDAARARAVLVAREARRAGSGATEADIDKMIANKDRTARKEWGI